MRDRPAYAFTTPGFFNFDRGFVHHAGIQFAARRDDLVSIVSPSKS
jgi:hypothetical protein